MPGAEARLRVADRRLSSADRSVPDGTSPGHRARAARPRRVGRSSASDNLGASVPSPVCALDARPLASSVGCRRRNFWGTAVPRERRENGGQDTPKRHRLSAARVQAARRQAVAGDDG